jgi:hypothetical protein
MAIMRHLNQKREQEDIIFGDESFPKQLDFVYDDSSLGAALCNRRAGKSYSAGLKLFRKGFEYPGSTVLYLALTRDSAKRIMWKDVLKDIAKKYNIDVTMNNTNLEMTLPNDSVIKIAGADASIKEREKFLGGKYPYVVVDEAGSFANELSDLIYEYLEPAVSDFDGTIDLIGTPTVFWQGFFCKVTEGREPGWSVHQWSTSDNPFMAENWAKKLAQLKARNPRVEETPGYKRMYLGLWVRDQDNLIYKYQPHNLINFLPEEGELDGQVLGIDLGFDDASAYTLCQYYFHDPILYIAKTFKKAKQIVDDVVATMKDFIETHEIHTIVIDNASKQVVETLKARFSLYDVVIYAAEKRDKIEFIGIMNSDFIMGRIRLLKSETVDYVEELENLIKDPNKLKITEHPSCDNHICDSALYAWRHARNYRAEPEVPKISEEDEQELLLEYNLDREVNEDEEFYDEVFRP